MVPEPDVISVEAMCQPSVQTNRVRLRERSFVCGGAVPSVLHKRLADPQELKPLHLARVPQRL